MKTATYGDRVWMGIVGFFLVLGCSASGRAALILTEIMYDPAGTNEFEYFEIYNTDATAVDLSNYRFADIGTTFFTLPAGSSIAGQGTAVIARTDGAGGRTLAGYQNAWGAGVNFIEPSGWATLGNVSDAVKMTTPDPSPVELFNISYGSGTNGFPTASDSASIYLKNVTLDPTVGANWALSVAGVDGAVQGLTPRALDVGSPGSVVVPEPAGAAAVLLSALALRRRRAPLA